MTWLTCMDLVMDMAYMSDGVYVLCLGGIYCTNWVRNSAEIQGLECEYPLCDLFRACRYDEDEISSFFFFVLAHGRQCILYINLNN